MGNDVNAEFTLFVLDEVNVGVDTFGLVPPRKFGYDKYSGLSLSNRRAKNG